MNSVLRIAIQGLDELARKLQAEEENVVQAMTKAHSKVSSLAVRQLKRGLSNQAGTKRSDADYKTSPRGTLPYAHSERLRDSMGMKIWVHGRTVTSEVGSGAQENGVVYAKYLEGRNGDGCRPFLWAVQELYTPEKIKEHFKRYYKPLSGGK